MESTIDLASCLAEIPDRRRAEGKMVSLVNSALYREAAAIFIGPAWRARDLILPRLNNVAAGNREFFAKALYGQGYELTVPGIQRPEWRPWR